MNNNFEENDPSVPTLMTKVGENEIRPAKPGDGALYQHTSTGLTKREYVATAIFAALLADGFQCNQTTANIAVDGAMYLRNALNR